MDFKLELIKYQEKVNEKLEKYIPEIEVPEKILYESMRYTLMAGGKRIRPILVMATYQLFHDNIEECLPYAAAIEMIHNSSLIHDDLPGLDNDDFRHGKPTNHKQFNESTAILAGDMLQNEPYRVISEDLMKTEQKNLMKKVRAFKEFSDSVGRMLAGQFVDTQLEGKEISEDVQEYIHKNKTGALLRLCVRMGAILADAPEEDLEKLTIYAENIGVAFQIKDDILSEEGDEKVLGKPVGNDKIVGKCTYVSMYGLQKAKDILHQMIQEAVSIIEQYGEKAQFLKELALYIENRNK